MSKNFAQGIIFKKLKWWWIIFFLQNSSRFAEFHQKMLLLDFCVIITVNAVESLCVCVCVCVCVRAVTSVASSSVTLWAVVFQSSLSTGFSRQEYWSGLPSSLLQGIFPIQGSNPHLLHLLRLLSLLHCRQILYRWATGVTCANCNVNCFTSSHRYLST